MTKTFENATSLRTWATAMGIKEGVWQDFQMTVKQGPMMREVTENGLTISIRIEQSGSGYRVTMRFSG